MTLIHFGSTCAPQVVVRAYHPSRVQSTRHQNCMSQINCLEASRLSMFSGSLPFLSCTGMSRNMRPRRGCRFTDRDWFADRDYAVYYSLLGVSEYSTLTEVKCAYRRLALSYHPDVNKDPGAEAKFIEITNAYEVLIDEKKYLHEDEVENSLPIKRICYDWYSLKTLKAKCTTCGGQGHVYTSVKTPLGVKQEPIACSSCNGTGHVLTFM